MTENTETQLPDDKLLSAFGTDLRCAVIGASGGIGSALVRHLARLPQVAKIHALSRTPMVEPPDKVAPATLDYDAPETIAAAAEACASGGPLDLVIVATGLLHDGDTLSPEKDWRHLEADALARVFRTNTIGPSLVAKDFLPVMRDDGPNVFAVLGARIGSITDNRIGGWYGYRASKAALAMIVANLAIELKRKRRPTLAVALHPGTVDTALSEPFQSGTKPGQVVPAETAAHHLLTVISRLSPDDSGGHFAWDGERIPA
jgi:NAD(P)-dependent dehydrogenase (short-subunit alcohol dehydrogenase family)